MPEVIRLDIKPEVGLTLTQNTWMIFKIPEVCLKTRGGKQGCAAYRKTGLCKHTLNAHGRWLKRRLKRYNDYKTNIYSLCKGKGFKIEAYPAGWAIYFFFPVPKYWTKGKKAEMNGQFHLAKPDIDKLVNAFFDANTIYDERVSQLSGLGKFWVNQERGYIEIHTGLPIYNPLNVQWIVQKKEEAKSWGLADADEQKKAKMKEIAAEYRKGIPQTKLAAMFGMSQPKISRILKQARENNKN